MYTAARQLQDAGASLAYRVASKPDAHVRPFAIDVHFARNSGVCAGSGFEPHHESRPALQRRYRSGLVALKSSDTLDSEI